MLSEASDSQLPYTPKDADAEINNIFPSLQSRKINLEKLIALTERDLKQLEQNPELVNYNETYNQSTENFLKYLVIGFGITSITTASSVVMNAYALNRKRERLQEAGLG